MIRDAINRFLHAIFSIKCKCNGQLSSGSIWSNVMLNLEIRSKFLYGYSCEYYDHGFVFRYIYIHYVEFEYFLSSFLIRTENLYCLSLLFTIISIDNIRKNRNTCKVYANNLHNMSRILIVNTVITMTTSVFYFFYHLNTLSEKKISVCHAFQYI